VPRDNLTYKVTTYKVTGQQKVDLKKGLIFDKTIQLSGFYSKEKYGRPLRLIGFYDSETKITYYFLTNNFRLSAWTIAQIYKARWQVEVFLSGSNNILMVKSYVYILLTIKSKLSWEPQKTLS